MTSIKKFHAYFFFVGIVLCSSAFSSNDIQKSQATCVGRLQLDLPVDFEIAVNLPKMLIAEQKVGSIQPRFQFLDGQNASWSHINYLGRIYVSPELAPAEYSSLIKNVKKNIKMAQASATKKTVEDRSYPFIFEELNISPYSGGASHVNGTYSASLFLNNKMIWLESKDNNIASQKRRFDMFLSGVKELPPHTIPAQDGICLPYFVILDNGNEPRNIGITYRLKTHPDITVFLEDSSARSYDNPIRAENAEPKNRLNDFWGQYELSATGKQVETIWRFPSARPVKIAGQNGLASFVKITRKNNSIDYGYLAVVRGDPDAKTDTPDLRFYVIREADHAKAKGFEPVAEKDFLEMAQAIAASIKHRSAK